MIRAIVVDDEKLARKGFISIIDWPLYGIEIVGEAGDGRTAIELIEEREPDLLITDITMPGMSGFELIERVRQTHPRMKSVVLTCHHEFDYVHEALRLGAIDYIVKTLIEMDKIDEVMKRIVNRIHWEDKHAFIDNGSAGKEALQAAIVIRSDGYDRHGSGTGSGSLPVLRSEAAQLGRGFLMLPLSHPIDEEELKRRGRSWVSDGSRILYVDKLGGRGIDEARQVLSVKAPDYWFYLKDGSDAIVKVTYAELERSGPMETEERLAVTRRNWSALRWTLYPTEWERFVAEIEQIRPASESVIAFAEALAERWSGWFGLERERSSLWIEMRSNRTWKDWRRWFREFAAVVQSRMEQLELSREAAVCLFKAVRLINERIGEGLTQEEVACQVNMSRSYFSQCFKRFAGESFGDFLRNRRIEAAKELLAQTMYGVYEIAGKVGFEDEKYFSRVFKDKAGCLPTEYRTEQQGKGKKTV